jgi:hypothetical protein
MVVKKKKNVRAQAFGAGAVLNQLVRSCAQQVFLE